MAAAGTTVDCLDCGRPLKNLAARRCDDCERIWRGDVRGPVESDEQLLGGELARLRRVEALAKAAIDELEKPMYRGSLGEIYRALHALRLAVRR